MIPTPQAVVFCNGTQEAPEQQILKLSDSFDNKEKKGCLEFECLVLNINYGKNRAIMNNCRQLMDYAKLIAKIRYYEQQEESLERAVNQAIEACIQEGILGDYLRQNLSEVRELVLSEYDEQRHIENEKKWSKEEGIIKGEERANKLTKLLLENDRHDDLEKALSDKTFRHGLMKEYGLM